MRVRSILFVLAAAVIVTAACRARAGERIPTPTPAPPASSRRTPTAGPTAGPTVPPVPSLQPTATPAPEPWACPDALPSLDLGEGVRAVFRPADAYEMARSEVLLLHSSSMVQLDKQGRVLSEHHPDERGVRPIRQVLADETLMRQIRERAALLPEPYANLPFTRRPSGGLYDEHFWVAETLGDLVDQSGLIVLGRVPLPSPPAAPSPTPADWPVPVVPRGGLITLDPWNRFEVVGVLKGVMDEDNVTVNGAGASVHLGARVVVLVQGVTGPRLGGVYRIDPQRMFVEHRGRVVPVGPGFLETTRCYRDMAWDTFLGHIRESVETMRLR